MVVYSHEVAMKWRLEIIFLRSYSLFTSLHWSSINIAWKSAVKRKNTCCAIDLLSIQAIST